MPKIEVKKDACRQTQDGTWKLTLTLHPDDLDTAMLRAPPGTRYYVEFAEAETEDFDTAAIRAKDPPQAVAPGVYGKSYAQEAGALCANERFQDWFYKLCNYQLPSDDMKTDMAKARSEIAAALLRNYLGISSRREIDSLPAAKETYNRLVRQYQNEVEFR